MEKQDLKEFLDRALEHGKELIKIWHEKKLEQIRLETANLRKIEEYKYHAIEEISRKKSKMFNKGAGSHGNRR